MEPTLTKKFSSAFDTNDKKHVLWFKSLHEATLEGESQVEKVLKSNPFGIKVSEKDLIEYINIQFILAMKYSTSVLKGDAWVPVRNNPQL